MSVVIVQGALAALPPERDAVVSQGAIRQRVARGLATLRRRLRDLRAAVAAAVVLWILLPTSHQEAPPPPVTTTTTRASCDVGARPGYFVPGDGPLALLGCARLPVSGRRVEFCANLSDIDGAKQLCINPAYGDGTFIPAICFLDPPVSEFAIRDATHPRQGVEGYGYVIWGTAGSARSVDATFDGGIAHAAVLPVPETLARNYGAPPFALSSPSFRSQRRAGP